LKPNLAFAQLDQAASRMSEPNAPSAWVSKSKLLQSCKIESPFPPRPLTGAAGADGAQPTKRKWLFQLGALPPNPENRD